MMDEILKKRANLQHKSGASTTSGNTGTRSPTPPTQTRNVTPPSGRATTPLNPVRNEPVSAPKPSVPPPKPVRTEAPPPRPVRENVTTDVSQTDAHASPPSGKPAAKGPPPAVPARKPAPPVPARKAAPLPPARHEVKPEVPARQTAPPSTPARVTTQASPPPVPSHSEMNNSPGIVTEGRFQFRTDLPPPPPFKNVPKHYKSGRANGAGTAAAAIPSVNNNVDYSREAQAMIETLKAKMEVHIKEMAFEKCSPLRDMIKKIEDQLAKNASSPDMKQLLDAARNLN
jgi:hypothetical protein